MVVVVVAQSADGATAAGPAWTSRTPGCADAGTSVMKRGPLQESRRPSVACVPVSASSSDHSPPAR